MDDHCPVESSAPFGRTVWRRSSLILAAAVLVVAAACAPTSPDPAAAPEESGRMVAERAGCFACHTSDGRSSTGPTWQGLFGSEVELDDGTTVTADEEYLRTSIVDPMAEVVAGFRAIMTTGFGDRLTDEEIEAIISYIRSLS